MARPLRIETHEDYERKIEASRDQSFIDNLLDGSMSSNMHKGNRFKAATYDHLHEAGFACRTVVVKPGAHVIHGIAGENGYPIIGFLSLKRHLVPGIVNRRIWA